MSFSKPPAWASGFTDPVSGVDFDFTTRVTNAVPVQLRNTETEQANLNSRIKALYDQGLSPRDATLRYMWFNISNEADKWFAENLIAAAKMLPEDTDSSFLSTISDFVNNKNYDWATTKLENTVLWAAKQAMWDEYIGEPKVKTAVQRWSTLENYMKQLPSSPVGIVKGTMQEWLWKLKGEEAQNIKTQVTQLVSKMRNDLIGASATAGEIGLLEPLIPDITDTPANFMIKLNNLKQAPLQEYNNVRTTYGLPPISESILLSGKKSELYRGAWSSPAAPTNTTNTDQVARFKETKSRNATTARMKWSSLYSNLPD